MARLASAAIKDEGNPISTQIKTTIKMLRDFVIISPIPIPVELLAYAHFKVNMPSQLVKLRFLKIQTVRIPGTGEVLSKKAFKPCTSKSGFSVFMNLLMLKFNVIAMAWEKLYNDHLAFYEHMIIINLKPNINLSFYSMRKILLVYKDDQIKKSIAAELKREGYDVLPISEETLNFTALDSAYLDLVVITLCADVASTWDMFLNLKEHFSDLPIVVYMGRCGPGPLKSTIRDVLVGR